MATPEQTKTFKSQPEESDGRFHQSIVQAVRENGLIISIFLLCSIIDTGLFSGFAPYLVLSGPTPGDSIYKDLPVILSGGLILFLFGLAINLSASLSNSVRKLVILASVALKFTLALSIYLGLNSGNLDSGPGASSGYLLIHMFCSICLYLSVASRISSQSNFVFLPFLVLILEGSKILYFAKVHFNPIETPLKETTSTCALGYFSLLIVAGAFCLYTDKRPAIKNFFLTPPDSLRFQLTLFTVTASMCWIPFAICLINFATASNTLITLTTILSAGLIFGVGLSNLSLFRNLKLPTLTFLLLMPLFTLTLSRWFFVSAISLFATGLISSLILRTSFQDILSRPKSVARYSSFCVGVAVFIIYFGATILSNSSILFPSTYLMQQIGCIFFCLFLLIALSFKSSQAHLASTLATVILNFKGGTRYLKKAYQINSEIFIVSNLSILKSLVISNYLGCPLIIFSNDGLLNWKPIHILLGFLNTSVYHSEKDIKVLNDRARPSTEKPIIYFHKDSLKIMEELNSWAFLEQKIESKTGVIIYSITSQQTQQTQQSSEPKTTPPIVSTAR